MPQSQTSLFSSSARDDLLKRCGIANPSGTVSSFSHATASSGSPSLQRREELRCGGCMFNMLKNASHFWHAKNLRFLSVLCTVQTVAADDVGIIEHAPLGRMQRRFASLLFL